MNAIELDRLEEMARRDNWHQNIVGSEIRQLIGLARDGLKLRELQGSGLLFIDGPTP